METIGGGEVRSVIGEVKPEDVGLEFLDTPRLLSVQPPDHGSSFTALLEMPPTQAMELLHSSALVDGPPTKLCSDPWTDTTPCDSIPILSWNDPSLVDRASKLAGFLPMADNSPESSSVPSSNELKVKQEPIDSDSNHNVSPALFDLVLANQDSKSAKRKERENKVKGSNKKVKSTANEATGDGEKLPYVHVRARRGQATDSHSLAERARREKINARMKLLQELVPGCNKISGTAMVLDEIINHVQSLQRQVEFLSMRLAAFNPRIDFNFDSLLAEENGSLTDNNYLCTTGWPEAQVDVNRQQHQLLWQFDELQQPVWSREEEKPNFITLENSLVSYETFSNSVPMVTSELKMEI